MQQKLTSRKFSLNQFDFLKSAVLAGLTVAVTTIATSIEAGHFPTAPELLVAAKIGALAACSYLIKQFLTPGYKLTPTETPLRFFKTKL